MEEATEARAFEFLGADGGDPGSNQPSEYRNPRLAEECDSTRIVIGATFTAAPLLQPLRFWTARLEIASDIALAPYGQVLQELLDPHSSFSTNKRGFNLLLLRFEDWIRDRRELTYTQNIEHLRDAARELLNAVQVLQSRATAPLLVFNCPISSSLPREYQNAISEIQSDLARQLGGRRDTYCWSHSDLVQLYPVPRHEDERADRIGHIPYTEEYFVAIATLLARRVTTLLRSRYKVIVLDCDNTLWKGICGEDGPMGVQLTPAHLDFQKMLVRQHDAGMLLCLCSKNNPADVEAVFEHHPNMPLGQDHIVASRINWEPKSSNLKSLAAELDLGLDSFLLIDDSRMECEEVRTNCPTALALHFPDTPEEIAHFMRHTWALDRMAVTEEGRRRTEQYKQNRKRALARVTAGTLEEFLASLQLKVDISPTQNAQIPRVAELVQRTNQFNLTGVRRRAAEIESLCNSAQMQLMAIRVSDRFGDYGLVGAVFLQLSDNILDVDTFVLSCRVLGRGVEHEIVRTLGRTARKAKFSHIVLRYRKTARNRPAWEFLERSFTQFKQSAQENGDDVDFVVPAEYAERLAHGRAFDEPRKEADRSAESDEPARSTYSTRWHEVSYRWSRIPDILQELSSAASLQLPTGERTSPRTELESAVADIFSEVLGVDDVDIEASFLEIGGDSVKAVQVIVRVESRLGLELSLLDFFDGPTVEGVARRLESASQAGPPVVATECTNPVPLSWAQQRLWFIDRLEGRSAAYNVPLMIRLRGYLDQTALRSALDTLLKRHEVLRTVLIEIHGEPVQQIASRASFDLRVVDLSAQSLSQLEADVASHARQEVAAPFDLSVGPLIRGTLLQLSPEEHVLLISMHHVISDGWSIGVLARELGELYTACHEGRPNPLPPLPIQYADYAQWQRHPSMEAVLQKQLAYWTEHLRGIPEVLELPTDRNRPVMQTHSGASVDVTLGSELTANLKRLSRSLGLTLAMTLCTAWVIVLSRLSQQRDIVVGMPVANRRRPELENLIGFFANTLAIRVRLADHVLVSDLLEEVKRSMTAGYANQDVPFDRVVDAIQPARSLSHSAVFQVMFVLQNAPRDPFHLAELTVTEEKPPVETAQFDLSLSLEESAAGLVGSLNYASDLFDQEIVERWADVFKQVLRGIVRNTHLDVDALPLMDEMGRHQVIRSFNETSAPYPENRLVHEVFEEHVARTPDAVAVLEDGRALSYAELNAQANQLAHYLMEHGMQVGECVPTILPRSLALLISELAVLKCGGAYVPMDPTLPPERLAFMAQDCGAQRIIAECGTRAQLGSDSALWICIDELASAIRRSPTANLQLQASTYLPAYVMYTSGSTGLPKGVVVPHRAVNRLAINNGYAEIGPADCVVHCSNPAFDASTFEVWTALLNGARVLITPQSIALDATRFARLLRQHGATALFQTTALFHQRATDCPETFHGLRYVLFGGEAADPTVTRRFVADRWSKHLLNVYGPTETTTFATTCAVRSVPENARTVPIGRPISNTQVYIVDRHLQPVPIGMTGEICIGGAGVALGYLNRPELSAQRFISDPFSTDPLARLYRTGDLARWRPNGDIEFLGRNDQQVKIRGFRIEPTEIAAQLLQHPNVKHAVVLARGDSGHKELVAYIVPDSTGVEPQPLISELREYLKRRLPDYMVPRAWMMLSELPLTVNGKVDTRALPAAQVQPMQVAEFTAPRTETERVLEDIWTQLLPVGRVGVHDNFFDLGGHSLLAIRVVARIAEILDADLTVKMLFDSPTIAELAFRLESVSRADDTSERLQTKILTDDRRREIDEMSQDEMLARIASLEAELMRTEDRQLP